MRNRVPRLAAAAAAVALAATLAPGGAARASSPLRPDVFAEAVRLSVEGREFAYWTADAARPVEFEVRGAGRVKLITRTALPGPDAEAAPYTVVVYRGEAEVAREEFAPTPARGVAGGGAPGWGCHRDVLFETTGGTARYRVEIEGTEAAVALRPRFLAPRRRAEQVSFSPHAWESVLTLVRDEREITYYRVTPGTPVRVTVTGPTRLRVSSRLDFDATMKGRAHSYSLEVATPESTWTRASFEVVRSQTSTWRCRPEIVPGTAKGFGVDVPEGRHELEIRLADTIAPGAAVRLSIPKKDLARR